ATVSTMNRSRTPPPESSCGADVVQAAQQAERALFQTPRNRRGPAFLTRADDGIRTRDPNLGKVVLYQLSHVRVGHHFSYLRNFEKRRSARGLPPVWHVGQYWSDLPEKATCRTRSPHTGQG